MRKLVLFAMAILVALASLQENTPKVDAQAEASSWVGGPVNSGVELTVDLAESQHIRNIGSKIDGAGMCVFSSIEMAARAQGLEQMRGWRDWCASKYPGGGWPEKVDETLAAWWKFKGIEPIPYYQYEGQDPDQVLKIIDRTGRMICHTYGYSPRYGGAIAHMVCSPLYGEKYAAVLDNNFPGEKNYEWMAPSELVRRMKAQGGSAWVFCWMSPGQPPLPRNLKLKG